MARCESKQNQRVVQRLPKGDIMLDFIKIKNDLEDNFQRDKSEDLDIDINVNVISESNGKFSVSIHNKRCIISNENLPKADITVGFVNKDVMIDMFVNGANPMGLVMGGQMTFNGDMAKGKSLKGLFVK
jgi:alkyl sulfatase BDS1-like metallo-beta-lactamase superfamily hydrolase